MIITILLLRWINSPMRVKALNVPKIQYFINTSERHITVYYFRVMKLILTLWQNLECILNMDDYEQGNYAKMPSVT